MGELVVGAREGGLDGLREGFIDGDTLGDALGCFFEGEALGDFVGLKEGDFVGETLGLEDGLTGLNVGVDEGIRVGLEDGEVLGLLVGDSVPVHAVQLAQAPPSTAHDSNIVCIPEQPLNASSVSTFNAEAALQ